VDSRLPPLADTRVQALIPAFLFRLWILCRAGL
jgi:hypothetical protein